MNFSLIHSTLKAAIKGNGFRYWESTVWFDLEVGKLPEAAMEDGFALRFVDNAPSEYGSDAMGRLNIEIEFAFEGRKDRYLTRMATAQTTVRALRGVLAGEGVTCIDDAPDKIFPAWTMQYFGEIVVMTFTITLELDAN